jgi:hypothetical protein
MLTITLTSRAEAVVRHKAAIHKRSIEDVANALLLDYEPSTPEEKLELAQRKTLTRLEYERRYVDTPRTLTEIWNNGFAHGYAMFQTRKAENLYFDVERAADATQVKP